MATEPFITIKRKVPLPKRVRHNEKEIAEIEEKLDNIKPDGSVIATKTQLGNVIVGDNINVDSDGKISVPLADNTGSAGLVRIWPGQNIDWNGITLSVPTATSQDKGVVKVGSTLTVNNGVINAPILKDVNAGVPALCAVAQVLSVVDSTNEAIGKNSGTNSLVARKATEENYGVVKIGDGLTIDQTNGQLKLESDPVIQDGLTIKTSNEDYDDINVGAGVSLDDNVGTVLTMSGEVDGTSYKPVIRNIHEPVQNYDAANKKYVDDHVVVPTYHLVELDANWQVVRKSSTLVYETIKANLTNPLKADYLDILLPDGGSAQRFYIPCVGIAEVNYGPLFFEGDYQGMHILYILDPSGNLRLNKGVLETELNKVQSVVQYYQSSGSYPSTTAVYNEFQRKPVEIYRYDGSGNKFVGQTGNLFTNPVWYDIEDLSAYKKVKIYITPSKHNVGLSTNNLTSSAIIEVDLDSANMTADVPYYTGSGIEACLNNDNRLYSTAVMIQNDGGQWKLALKTVSLYGTSSTDITDSYVYRAEGYFD